ncbi:hypothetical protein PVAP13_1KG545550 [Panicum virgatum]|uniref:Uncharacterized protein n=1 Tax=Panicum virgatum TaxID=38727 RepID=A0A8T0XRS8_PANVG|nr:hypothetical protein PVAP13_1KG545550 [Panicum virgatum]
MKLVLILSRRPYIIHCTRDRYISLLVVVADLRGLGLPPQSEQGKKEEKVNGQEEEKRKEVSEEEEEGLISTATMAVSWIRPHDQCNQVSSPCIYHQLKIDAPKFSPLKGKAACHHI